jgi:hypothetical protein
MPSRSNFVNKVARVKVDVSFVQADRPRLVLPKGTTVAIIDWDLQASTGVIIWKKQSLPINRSQIEVLKHRFYTNDNSAGRIFNLRVKVAFQTQDVQNRGFSYTPDHNGQIDRMSSDGSEFIVNIVSGRDKGRKDIRVPVHRANILYHLFPTPSWLNKRVKFRGEYFITDENGNNVHTFPTDHQTAIVRQIIGGGKRLMVSTPDKWEGRHFLTIDYWAVEIHTDLREIDVKNHTFKALRDQACLVVPADILRKDTVGVVTSCTAQDAEVTAIDGIKYKVPLTSIQVGSPIMPYRISYGTTTSANSQTSIQSANSSDDTVKVVTSILKSMYTAGPSLPPTARQYETFYSTDNARMQQAVALKDGFNKLTLDCLKKKCCIGDIEDLKRLPDATNSFEKGVYVRIYEGFEKSSQFYGKVYIYVGKTNNFYNRNAVHCTVAKTKQSRHYIVMNAAKQRAVRILWVQRSDDKKQRALVEALCTLLSSSMDSRVTVLSDRDSRSVDSGAGSFDFWSNAKAARILKDITDTVFQTFGFSYPSSQTGKVEGLNVSVPIQELTFVLNARRWVRHALDDRLVFTSGPLTFKRSVVSGIARGHYYQFTISSEMNFFINFQEDISKGLTDNTTFWSSWEVTTNGRLHEAPFFRVPKIGFTDNWEIGNRIGLRITWKDAKTGKHYSRYEQFGHAEWNEYESIDQGSLKTHTVGAALWAVFTRSQWGTKDSDRPGFYPSNHTIEILDLRVDHFRQEYTIEVDLSPVNVIPRVTINLEGAANQMRRLGLENVNGQWRGFRYTNAENNDPANQEFTGNKVQVLKKFVTARQHCDRCTHLTQFSGYDAACEQAKDTNGNLINRCTVCVRRGLPCSWT